MNGTDFDCGFDAVYKLLLASPLNLRQIVVFMTDGEG